jgi:hypothetical protein
MAGALHVHLGRLVLSSLRDACHLSNRSEALVPQAASERGEIEFGGVRGVRVPRRRSFGQFGACVRSA